MHTGLPPQLLEKLTTVQRYLASTGPRVVACSGGIDSMLLAYIAHRQSPPTTLVVHGASPAVPQNAQLRIQEFAAIENWQFKCVTSGEFENEEYLKNPQNRCYYCKQHLYSALATFRYNSATELFTRAEEKGSEHCVVLSGTNFDDLGEYRPGLEAAMEHGVQHPFVDAKILKSDIRGLCRHFGLSFSEIPASPCLASRLYTGTRVTARRLELVDKVETNLRERTSVKVLRGRLQERKMLIEIADAERHLISPEILEELRNEFLSAFGDVIDSINIDGKAYKPGRAFVIAP